MKLPRNRLAALTRLSVVLLCAAGALASLVAYRSERRLEEALTAGYLGEAGHLSDAQTKVARLLDEARPLNPDSEIDVSRALFLRKLRPQAEAILRTAIRREPDNVRLWLALTQVRVRDGRHGAARRSYERARELDPQLPR